MITGETHPSLTRLYEVTGLKKPSELATNLNVGASTVTNWAKRGVSKEGALLANEKFGASANYILTGNFEPIIHASQVNSGHFHNSPVSQSVSSPNAVYHYDTPNIVSLNFYEQASLNKLGSFVISLSLAQELHLNPSLNLFALPIIGKDMQPTLPDKSIVIANSEKAVLPIYDGQIYALKMGDSIRCRYLEQLSGGRVRVYSEQNNEGEIFEQSEFDKHYQIMGGIIWQSNFFNW